jgi:hypothetical protein
MKKNYTPEEIEFYTLDALDASRTGIALGLGQCAYEASQGSPIAATVAFVAPLVIHGLSRHQANVVDDVVRVYPTGRKHTPATEAQAPLHARILGRAYGVGIAVTGLGTFNAIRGIQEISNARMATGIAIASAGLVGSLIGRASNRRARAYGNSLQTGADLLQSK